MVTIEVVYTQNSGPLLQCNKSQFIWAAPSSQGQSQNRRLTNTAHHVPPADQQQAKSKAEGPLGEPKN